MIAERHRGIRPAFGYPACPDHSEKRKLFDLLGAEEIGIELTGSFAMFPAASVSGIYLEHPQAKYFSVGRIGRDQVADYAARKGVEVEEVEHWLAPNLDYETPVGRGRDSRALSRQALCSSRKGASSARTCPKTRSLASPSTRTCLALATPRSARTIVRAG